MSVLPSAIEQQEALANQLMEQLAQSSEAQAQSDLAAQQTSVQAPSVEQQATQMQEPAQQVFEDPNSKTWEQRYKSLQGMHRADLERKTAEVEARIRREFEDRMRNLEEASRTEKAEPAAEFVTKEDSEAYGEDLVGLMRRVCHEHWNTTALPEIQRRMYELNNQVSAVQNVQGQTLRERFTASLTEAVPNWQQIDNSEDWALWLSTEDELYGLPRKAALESAIGAADATRTIKMFKAFLAQSGAQVPQPQPNAQNRDLQRQVAPASNASVAPIPQTNSRVWTQKDINKFYDDVRRGEIKPDDALRIEADLFAASQEGRIR